MKLKFVKNYLSFKADAVEVIEDAEIAKTLIEKGFAVEVKETAEEAVAAAVKEAVEPLVKQAAERGYTEGVKAGSKELAKGIKAHTSKVVVGQDNILSAPGKGFRNLGEYACTVKAACLGSQKAQNDVRLKSLYTVENTKGGMFEGDGTASDGSYAVPVEYANEIFTIINSEDKLMPRCFNIPTKTNQLKLPIDNLTTIGTNAITGTWVAEDGTAATVKGGGFVNQISFDLHKYITLISATEELLDDNNVALTEWLVQKAAYDIDYQVNQSIVQGVEGMGTGWVGHAATLSVPAYSGQAAKSIVYENVTSMFTSFLRTPRASQQSVIWVVNYYGMGELLNMTDPSGKNIYFPAMSSSVFAPYGTLLGIPVVLSFHASALGTPGDISLVDLSAFTICTKSNGVEAAQSIHLYFDKDETAFRFTYRMDCRPGLNAPFTLPDGSGNQVSPFVTLASRASS